MRVRFDTIKILAVFGTLAVMSACSAFENFQRVGVYAYEGEEFDVYTADDVEHTDGVTNDSYLVLVPKGADPHHLNVVAQCRTGIGAVTASTVRGCETAFGISLRESRQPDEEREGGGMGY
ncbi:hypothetical protein [Cochlodiniinecator piscidefendens]|uniref:hypothetical protein n=1 Tax=Cochlodiniinecator piscidefendens TaxID=2715756 RepID=UPI00140E5429|nr:hypothetical protein [Cochlodiniinecator piscidefendens]